MNSKERLNIIKLKTRNSNRVAENQTTRARTCGQRPESRDVSGRPKRILSEKSAYLSPSKSNSTWQLPGLRGSSVDYGGVLEDSRGLDEVVKQKGEM